MKVVQFMHPGGIPKKHATEIKPWGTGKHSRTLLKVDGKAVDSPCSVSSDSDEMVVSRPVLDLPFMSPRLSQGYRFCDSISPEEAWEEVTKCVLRQGMLLGTEFVIP